MASRKLNKTRFAARADLTPVKLSRLLKGEQKACAQDIQKLIINLDLPKKDACLLTQLSIGTRKNDGWRGDRATVPKWFRIVHETELDATEIRNWTPHSLPGPLQSELLVLSLYQLDGAVDMTPQVRMREARKKLFGSRHLKRYDCVVGESFFNHLPLQHSREVAYDQICHLRDAIPRERALSFRVLPISAEVRFLYPEYLVLHFEHDPLDFVFIEHLTRGITIPPGKEMDQYLTLWREISDAALSPRQTAEFLTARAELLRP
ncbi:hypothetical protein JOF53_003304 [Crossiella equi]|uniref:DUF5753 domain-containing protein n=1 Tax=Crossiella equi TaxID=130796 RepID=A0ABS5ADQ3_9PSEU|nr:Scr1 family TA system antitoxin-like transcriptional regulator [Crossiella equi]MBP2474432.1 hypothetical protein [Crossiella equi]